MNKKTLQRQQHLFSRPDKQLDYLSNGIFAPGKLPSFSEQISRCQQHPLQTKQLEILQLNLGYKCNQVCAHCHVDAGPDRKEMMSRKTLEQALQWIEKASIKKVDLTGGAPEMHPDFRWFVSQAKALGVEDLMVRSNLTILVAHQKYADLPSFFKANDIHVISSLPFYKKEKTDRQRGDGVFAQSIKALKALNTQGYGKADSGLLLDLVYNPAGAFLPGNQTALQQDFKKALWKDYQIEFNNLFTITNLPISRFLDYLIASENYERYMTALVDAFNPAALSGLMCTNTLSVRWDGSLYDCDFNQMLDLKIQRPNPTLGALLPEDLEQRTIAVHQHCYGCTAGAGSSCQGSLT